MNWRNRAFTLVELLVVIGIIAIMISVLLPVLGRARQSAESVQCMSNLRQIGQAAVMYANENKGSFPQPCSGGTITVGTPPQTISNSDSFYRFSMSQAAEMSRLLKGNTKVWYCPSNKFNPPPGQPEILETDFYPPYYGKLWVGSPITSGRTRYWWVANPTTPDYKGTLVDVTGSGDFFASASPNNIPAPAYRDSNRNGSIRDEYMRKHGEKNGANIVICTDQSGNINQAGWYFIHGKLAVIPFQGVKEERKKFQRSWKNNLYGDGHAEQKRPDEVEWRHLPPPGASAW